MRWIAFCAVLAVSHVATAGELRGKVVSIADGDTITILDPDKVQHKIRLQGIDAPEKKQAFGTKSKELLTEKIAGHQVVIEWKEKDRYGRILGEVMLGRRHINLEMVQEGMAWHYVQYSKSKELERAELQARQARRGLWADKDPIPPWEFRKAAKVKAASVE
ncbi:MAG: nucH [Schlesneria sp.]|nr:nucH [Schlesneria sp.]